MLVADTHVALTQLFSNIMTASDPALPLVAVCCTMAVCQGRE
jgi:hypothetical protein